MNTTLNVSLHPLSRIRACEQAAQEQGLDLMAQAGLAAARFMAARFGKARPIGVLVGPGNNGGDALVAASHLRQWGYWLEVILPEPGQQRPPQAEAALRAFTAAGGQHLPCMSGEPWVAALDGLFGIGLSRPLHGVWQTLVDELNARAVPVLALDIPSGLHAESGAALGRPVQARWTLSFIAQVPGLYTGAALNAVGERHLASLGQTLEATGSIRALCQPPAALRSLARQADTHKGRFGTVVVAGGCAGMAGAVALAGEAALQVGAGKVQTVLLDAVDAPYNPCRPELLQASVAQIQRTPGGLPPPTVVAVGPGLGQSQPAKALLQGLLESEARLVLDADALNLLAAHAGLRVLLQERHAPTILTPHPTEAARLAGVDTAAIQANRYHWASLLSASLNGVVVLKGAGTVLARHGQLAVNTTGTPAQANAGQGDVLTGIIAGLWAQGLSAWDAACAGTYLHGLAAEQAAQGRHVVLAGGVNAILPTVLHRLIDEAKCQAASPH